MKYSLDLDEPLEDEVRRIASGRLAEAGALLRGRPEGLDNAIHDARRHIKQCRALYRLVASGAKDFQRAENERLGRIGRSLSHLRDAKALIEASEFLRHAVPTKSNGLLMDRLARRLDQRRADITTSSEEAAEALAAAERELLSAVEALSGLSLPRGRKSTACLARGWETVGRKGRAAMKASEQGHDDAFHDMRKRTQDRWMHAALMRDLWPSALSAIQYQGKTLSDMLGQAQDLAILHDTVTTSTELVSDAVESEAIRDLITAQQQKLQGECRELALALFSKAKPRDEDMIERLLLDR